MKKWECGVCGYVHEGDEAPEKCPICEAPQEMFTEVSTGDSPAQEEVAASVESEEPATAEETKWECSVCGYIHTGEAAPMTCPICEADQKMFNHISGPLPEVAIETQDEGAAPAAEAEKMAEVAAVTEAEDVPEAAVAASAAAAEADELVAAADKKWRCTVCGYIHDGPEPPEKCPICHAPAGMFEEVAEDGGKKGDAGAKRWRCTVCGYIHEGEESPEKCPVCAAAQKMFVEVDGGGKPLGDMPVADADPVIVPQAAPAGPPTMTSRLIAFIMKFHVHPISVHFPNGIIPVAVVFLGIFLLFGVDALEKAAFFNNIFVLIMLPIVIVTGFIEWQKRYKGIKTAIFIIKIICAVAVLGAANVLVFWRIIDPAVCAVDSPSRYIYFGIAAGMLAAVGIAGHLGGNLVFKTRG